ncbi:hypothetical protein, partial [Leptospira jelokensis]|uniref:hypothetical protein n=1 Tax=Leptospira jelokensis TaxID=2484931 RepID=UPI001ABFDF92
KMSAGPFIEKLPYGINISCGETITKFQFPKLNPLEFIDNPLRSHSLAFQIENCPSDQLKMSVNRNTPYSILMLAELEIFELKK